MYRIFFICFAITLMMLCFPPFQPEKSESLHNKDDINLLDDNIIWNTTQNVELNKTGKFLNMTVDINNINETNYNRIFTITNLTTELHPNPLLKITYSTNSTQGNPKFIFEVRSFGTLFNQSNGTGQKEDKGVPEFLGSIDLGHTLGFFTTRNYELPTLERGSNHELRFYITTDRPTNAYLTIKNATIFLK